MAKPEIPRAATRRPGPLAHARPAARLLTPALAVAALTLLAAGLRLYQLGRHDYWDDEVISTFAARPPLLTILGSVGDYSVHPPLYYMLLHLWMGLAGEQIVALRTLSALVGAACVPLIYLLGRRVAGAPVGLLAAALLAISPFQILHAQQARMYPLLTLVVLAAALAWLSAWRHGGWRWGVVAACVAAGLYTHIYFVFSLLALNLWAALETLRAGAVDRRRWAGLVAAQALGGLAFLPFAPQLASTVGGVVQWYWVPPPTPFSAVGLPVVISNGSGQLLDQPGGPTLAGLLAVTAATVAFLLTNLHAIRAARRPGAERSGWALLLLLLWCPPVAGLAISLAVRPILIDRSLIAVTAPTYLLMAWALVELRRSPLALGAGGAFALSVGLVLASYYGAPPAPNTLRAAVATIAERREPGDAVAFADWQSFDTALLTRPDLPDVHVLPGEAVSRVQFTGAREWERRLRYIGWPHLDRVLPVAEFAPRYRRVWLVLTAYTASGEYQLATNKAWLDTNGRLIETIEGDRSVTWLYAIP